ncbi:hypothetical protein GP486_003074, partial [Trichoglossum hirsutum]
MDYSLLDVQAQFCKSKGRGDMALECAKRGVIAAPSEFGTWARLAEIYVSLEEWELALLTLNSCPMFTYQDKDAPRMPEPARILLPILAESRFDEIDVGESAGDMELVHPTLRKLHAAGYKGTFLKAYALLTEITAKIGWDQLLKYRSNVFVMEEEYRSERATTGGSQNASTTALRGTPNPSINENGAADDSGNEAEANGDGTPEEATATSTAAAAAAAATAIDGGDLNGDSIEKPEHTVASEGAKDAAED